MPARTDKTPRRPVGARKSPAGEAEMVEDGRSEETGKNTPAPLRSFYNLNGTILPFTSGVL
ncbi:MAG: hypothetical protein H2173_08960 [Opitutus sp.]|nr:hypothetical protein [Opitutus sp.]